METRRAVSDRGIVFLGRIWHDLFKLQGVDLHYSTVYHPQMDGQTKVMNHCLEGYLRCMVGELPYTWLH